MRSGKYTFNIMAVLAKTAGKCSPASPPRAFQQIIKAAGPVSL